MALVDVIIWGGERVARRASIHPLFTWQRYE